MSYRITAPHGEVYAADVSFTNGGTMEFWDVSDVDIYENISVVYHDKETTFLNMRNVLQVTVKEQDGVVGMDVPRVLRGFPEEGDQV